MYLSEIEAPVAPQDMQALAEAGHAFAQHYLGVSYHLGLNVEQNNEKAAYWWGRAADQHHREAQFLLGQFYSMGNGVAQDLAKAAELFGLAAGQGHCQAQINLAGMLIAGQGVDQDEGQARRLLALAANDHGSAEAAAALARMYEDGVGGNADDAQAYEWYCCAVRHQPNHVMAAYGLSMMLYHGRVPGHEPVSALAWLRHAGQLGYPMAQALLAEIHIRGEFGAPDYVEARRWAALGAANNMPHAQYWLGVLHGHGVDGQPDYPLCLQYLGAAANAGLSQATFALGMMYLHGTGVEKDARRALQYFIALADQDNVEAMFLAASALETELLRPAEAVEWYRRAANAGHGPSQYNLAALYHKGPAQLQDLALARSWYQACVASSKIEEHAKMARSALAELA